MFDRSTCGRVSAVADVLLAKRSSFRAGGTPCPGGSTKPSFSPSLVPRCECETRAQKYADTKEIARRFLLSDAHVRRILRVGYLAPDIIEAIIEGRQPRSLTVKRLLRGIPCAWADQRAAFGFG